MFFKLIGILPKFYCKSLGLDSLGCIHFFLAFLDLRKKTYWRFFWVIQDSVYSLRFLKSFLEFFYIFLLFMNSVARFVCVCVCLKDRILKLNWSSYRIYAKIERCLKIIFVNLRNHSRLNSRNQTFDF